MEMDGQLDPTMPISNWVELDIKMDGVFNLSEPQVTNEILALIAEIDEFKGAWRVLGRIAPERLAGLHRVATIESVGSSTRIEGAKLTDREVERLLTEIEIKSFETRDEQEVAGYAEVMEQIFTAWAAIDLTENHIKQLHRDLLNYSTKDERHRGEYKTLPNHIEAFGPDGRSLGVVFETATPFDTPRLMGDLVAWTRAGLDAGKVHPLLVIAVFVVAFLAIHPFQDGNGRLSRILTTLLLLRAGYAYVPYSSLESVIEQSKEAYYLALRQTQATMRGPAPDWLAWVLYFLRALQQQKTRLETKIKLEQEVLGRLPDLSVQILELVRAHGRVTVGVAAKATGVSRNTIKDHVKKLVEKGHLTRHGAGRGTWYSLA
jgi:Fic family protein